MDLLRYVVDYGVIGLLMLMSILAAGVAVERKLAYRKIRLAEYRDKKTLELALTKRLHIIATVGSNAPYVGLLGTVLGIMLTFATIGKQGLVNTGEIMTGLALALKATAIGLTVAIPAIIFYNFLLRAANELLLRWEIENGTEKL